MVDWAPANGLEDYFVPAENLTSGSVAIVTGTITTSNTSSSVTVTQPYLIQAAEWGRQAGQQWVEDLREQWVMTTASATFGHACFQPRTLTPEELEEQGRRQREAEYRRDRASWRAHDLLMANLTPRQREDYTELGRFTVVTRRKHRYVIGKAGTQNVARVNRRGKPMRVYCVTVHGVPLEDALLGQKLMLEHDEGHFLRVARQWPVRFGLGLGELVKLPQPSIRFGDGAIYYPPVTEAA